MISYSINENELKIGNKSIVFNYPICQAEEVNGLIIVLLRPKGSYDPMDFINELYAVSDNCQIGWKMEDVKKHIGNIEPSSLVGFSILDGKIVVIDYSARKYFVDIHDGRITGTEAGRW